MYYKSTTIPHVDIWMLWDLNRHDVRNVTSTENWTDKGVTSIKSLPRQVCINFVNYLGFSVT